jgi:predicted transcriptional regulator
VDVRSLRLDPELDDKLRRAAAAEEKSVSEFIRRAAEERADEVLGRRTSERFSDVAGVISGGGGRARRSGKAFTEQLTSKKSR